MNEQQRPNIAILARYFRQNGYPPTQAPLDESELYAITSVLGDRIIRRAYALKNQRPPFGLITTNDGGIFLIAMPPYAIKNYRLATIEDIDPHYPFFSVSDFMRDTLLRSTLEEIEEIRSDKSTPQMVGLWQRLEKVLSIRHSLDNLPRTGKGSEGFIASGTNFASLVMAGTLDVINYVSTRKNRTTEKMVETAQNSYAFINKLASGDNGKVIMVLNYLSTDFPGDHLKFKPRYFYISESVKDHPTLQLSSDGEKMLRSHGLSIDSLRYPETKSCPGLVNFEKKSAIKTLWDWHVEIAEKIYPRLVARKIF